MHQGGKQVGMEDSSELERIRLDKLQALQENGVDSFPARVERTHTTREAIVAYESAEEGSTVPATVVGRIRSIREMGKVTFTHIEDGDGQLQLFLRKDDLCL